MMLLAVFKNKIMLSIQVQDMLTMDDATLKRYLRKECKHKEEILARIASLRNEALADKQQNRFNELSWLYNVVKGIEVLCP